MCVCIFACLGTKVILELLAHGAAKSRKVKNTLGKCPGQWIVLSVDFPVSRSIVLSVDFPVSRSIVLSVDFSVSRSVGGLVDWFIG